MTAEQEAIERLRTLAKNAGDSHDMYPAPTAADLRALLDSRERLAAVERRRQETKDATLDELDTLRTIAAQLAEALDLAEWLKYGHDAEIPYCIGCDMCVDESHSRCDHGIHKGYCKVRAALEAWEAWKREADSR